MENRGLFDRVAITQARGKKVRPQWLDEGRGDDNGEKYVRSRLVAMELNQGQRFDTFAGWRPASVHLGSGILAAPLRLLLLCCRCSLLRTCVPLRPPRYLASLGAVTFWMAFFKVLMTG